MRGSAHSTRRPLDPSHPGRPHHPRHPTDPLPSLGDIVFNDKAKRKTLTSIVNPEIAKVLGMAFVSHFVRGTPVLVLDVPLLFETGINQFCSEVMTVYLDESTQLKRLMARDTAGEADATARIASQVRRAGWACAGRGGRTGSCRTAPHDRAKRTGRSSSLDRAQPQPQRHPQPQPYPMEKKVGLSTYPLDNSGTPEELTEKLDALMGRIKRRSWGNVLIRPFLLACVAVGLAIPVLVFIIPAYS